MQQHVLLLAESLTAVHDAGTDRSHVFELPPPPDYLIELAVDPADPRARDLAFTLESTDGAYRSRKTVEDDLQPGDLTTLLCFERVLPGKRYSLFVHGPGGEGYHVFVDCPFAALVG